MNKDEGRYLFTSESVTEGHPDKMADQISDAILDAVMKGDPGARVAIETLITTGLVVVAGELTTDFYVDIPHIVRRTIKKIGYENPSFGFDCQNCGILTSIQQQSRDIALGVNAGGAGDQGMMFGYATTESENLMPLPITVANRITKKLAQLRKSNRIQYLRPDGKSQVTVEYIDGIPVRIDTIVISAHHARGIELEMLKEDMMELIVKDASVIPQGMVDKNTKILVNPTGRFEIGGPNADTGLTGRKIICDTYGGTAPHGGGAFSGKDPSKVDRSAAYMARHIAKSVVNAGFTDKCLIQLSYAIGVAAPVAVFVEAYNGKALNEEMSKLIEKRFDLTPNGIIADLKLHDTEFEETARYGHFGKDPNLFKWEGVRAI